MDNFESIVNFYNEIMDLLQEVYKEEFYDEAKNGVLASRVAIYELFRKKYGYKEIERRKYIENK